MIIYLASDMGGVSELSGRPEAVTLKKENGYLANIKSDLDDLFSKDILQSLKCLVLPANPKTHDFNAEYINALSGGFKLSGINVAAIDVWDDRGIVNIIGKKRKHQIPSDSIDLNEYQVLFLMGGHAPTQNEFFETIGLKETIRHFEGIILALSAGTMNCADTVYCIPEKEGESEMTTAQRFRPGLGLTSVSVIPHFQYLKTLELDNQRLIRDIVCADSFGRAFVALLDGSYIRIDNDDSNMMMFGEAYGISDGEIWKL